MKLLSILNVKQKVFTGFGLMQILIVAVAISALISLSSTESDVVVISDDIQPAVLAATELQYHIERANSSLGFYLLSHEQSHKDSYLESLAKVDVVLGKLQSLPMVQDQPLLKDHVNEIAGGVNQFKQYRDRTLALATNALDNQPAVKFASAKLNPFAQQMLALTSSMIQSESEEEVSEARRKLLLDIEKVRYSTSNVMNGLRAYLAFRQQAALDEVALYQDNLTKSVNLVKAESELLSLDQADALDQFERIRSQFNENVSEMVKLHSSEKWRMDSYLIKTEIEYWTPSSKRVLG